MATLALRNAVRQLNDGRRAFELRIASLTLAPGERKAIVGPSGSGKTTAMDILALASMPDSCDAMGLHTSHGGWSNLYGVDPERLAQIRAQSFGYVLQTAGLLPFLSVGDNIRLPQRLAGRLDPDHVTRLMRALDIEVPLKTMPSALSVGQRQRVAIARALAHRPAFVLADEPTAALDPATAARVVRLLVDLAVDHGAAIMVISHDQALMANYGFQILPVHFSVRNERCLSVIEDEG